MDISEGERPQLSRRDILKMGIAAGARLFLAECGERRKPALVEIQRELRTVRELPPLPEFLSPDYDQKAVAVLLKNPKDEEPISQAELENTLTTVSNFYDQISYGKIHYTFTTLPWKTVLLNLDQFDKSRLDRIARMGDAVLEHSSIENIEEFKTRIYIVPNTDFLKVQGYGRQGQPSEVNRVWIPVDNGERHPDQPVDAIKAPLDYVIEHELGHTLGLQHEDSLFAKIPNNYTENVKRVDKGGMYFDITQRVQLGWIKQDQIHNVSSSGVYTLSPIGTNNAEAMLGLRLQKGDTDQRYYVVYDKAGDEYRLEYHLWDEKIDGLSEAIGLQHGASEFRDGVNGITIRKVSGDDEHAAVQVTFNS